MNKVKQQAQQCIELIGDPTTANTYKACGTSTWKILKQIAILLWLGGYWLYVAFAWMAINAYQLLQAYLRGHQAIADKDQGNVATEAINAIWRRSRRAVRGLYFYAKQQIDQQWPPNLRPMPPATLLTLADLAPPRRA